MPRLKRKTKRRQWHMGHIFQLRTGSDIFAHLEAWGDDPDEEAMEDMRHAWDALGPALLEQHIRQCPGSRCHAWWLFSSPEPRDKRIQEAEQLAQLGLLSESERGELSSY